MRYVQPTGLRRKDSVMGSSMSEVIYGNDVDSVDIAVRAALVKFFNSPNVLGGFSQHSRILRLYPRPVVAVQKDAFIRSRLKESEFVKKLAAAQVSQFSFVYSDLYT